MKLFKKLVDWCLEEKEPLKEEEQKFYIPCKNFFHLSEVKTKSVENAKTLK